MKFLSRNERMLEAAYEFYSVGNYKKADAIMKEIVKRVVRKRL